MTLGLFLVGCQTPVASPGMACVVTVPQEQMVLRYGFDGFGRFGQTKEEGAIPCVRRLSEKDQAEFREQLAILGLDAPARSVVLTTSCPPDMVQVDFSAEGRRWSHRVLRAEANAFLRFCERCSRRSEVPAPPNARYAWEGDPWAGWRQNAPSN